MNRIIDNCLALIKERFSAETYSELLELIGEENEVALNHYLAKNKTQLSDIIKIHNILIGKLDIPELEMNGYTFAKPLGIGDFNRDGYSGLVTCLIPKEEMNLIKDIQDILPMSMMYYGSSYNVNPDFYTMYLSKVDIRKIPSEYIYLAFGSDLDLEYRVNLKVGELNFMLAMDVNRGETVFVELYPKGVENSNRVEITRALVALFNDIKIGE